jgi:hypothetical protein
MTVLWGLTCPGGGKHIRNVGKLLETARRNNPEDSHLYTGHCDSLECFREVITYLRRIAGLCKYFRFVSFDDKYFSSCLIRLSFKCFLFLNTTLLKKLSESGKPSTTT